MILRPFLHEETACASYLFGCLSRSSLAVADPHAERVASYLESAERVGARIVELGRRHNRALRHGDEESFARALLVDLPPPPPDQAAIVAANRCAPAPAPL